MTIDERVAALERRQRRTATLAAGLAIVLGVLILTGAHRQTVATVVVAEEVRAKRFLLVDGGGVERGRLGVMEWKDGTAAGTHLILDDTSGFGVSALAMSLAGSSVSIGVRGVTATDEQDGRVHISAYRKTFAERSKKRAEESGAKIGQEWVEAARSLSPTVAGLSIRSGHPINTGGLEVSIKDDGSAELSLSSVKPFTYLGRSIKLRTTEPEGPALSIVGSDGTSRLHATIVGDEPAMHLIERGGRVRAVLGHVDLENRATGSSESRPASSLVLFGPDGKVIESLPR